MTTPIPPAPTVPSETPDNFIAALEREAAFHGQAGAGNSVKELLVEAARRLREAEENVGAQFTRANDWRDQAEKQRLRAEAAERRVEREGWVMVPREQLQDSLNYIKHCGANVTMRGHPHPQQHIVDWLEAALSAAPKEPE